MAVYGFRCLPSMTYRLCCCCCLFPGSMAFLSSRSSWMPCLHDYYTQLLVTHSKLLPKIRVIDNYYGYFGILVPIYRTITIYLASDTGLDKRFVTMLMWVYDTQPLIKICVAEYICFI